MKNKDVAFEALVDKIRSYESDTFSANACGLTVKSAEKMAIKLLENLAESIGNSIDGVCLRTIFEETVKS